MSKTVLSCFQDIYKKNLVLLQTVRDEKWEQVVEVAENYVIMIHDVFDDFPQELTPQEKDSLRDVIQNLQSNEKEIADRLKGRLSLLNENMSALHHGNKCSQLYNTQYMSIMPSMN